MPPTPKIEMKEASAYHVSRTWDRKALGDVGQLSVTLVGAHGLFAADFGGKSDPFATIKLRDTEYETETLNKTLNPEWNETHVFHIEARILMLMP